MCRVECSFVSSSARTSASSPERSATTAVDVLVYAAVVATIVSGADYFFGVRRRIERQRSDGDPAEAGPA